MAKKPGVGSTATGAAVCRLIEQYQPEKARLFNDPVAKHLLGPVGMLMGLGFMRNFLVKQMEAIMPGLYGAQVCRTRFIDDAVNASLAKGIGQLVILGAGLDSRPYRLAGMERVKVFEVDLPPVQDEKKKRLQKFLGRLPENVTYIPVDFDKQSLDSAFAGTAFDPSKPVLFIWEGVTQYLPGETVRKTLDLIGKSAPGSVVLFTYVLRSVVERRSDLPNADRIMDRMAKGSPWLFGLEPSEVPAFLKPFHLDVVADVGNAYYQETYLKPIGRQLAVSEVERSARAIVTGH